MHIENIKAAIAVMERTPDDEFYLGNWFCGTAACFGGALARSPEGRAMGLTIVRVDNGDDDEDNEVRIEAANPSNPAKPFRHEDAIGHVLDLDPTTTWKLCYPSGYAPLKTEAVLPKHVVEKLQKLLRDGTL